jgi:hypothetical protein
MRTLREMGIFVGIPNDSPEFGAAAPIGLRLIGRLLASATTTGERASFRALESRLRSLKPVEFDAVLLNPSGVEPHKPVFRIRGTSGLVISTTILYSQSGRLLATSDNFGAAGGDHGSLQLGPGSYSLEVRRTGIGDTGYVRLSRVFTANVTRVPVPPPPDPPIVRPQVTATQSGGLSAIVFTVDGSGFLANQPGGPQGITVRFVDGVNFQNWVMLFTGSDPSGRIHLVTGSLDATLLARNAAGQAVVHISATDKRRDPGSTPANEPLWSPTVTFRF